MTTCKQCKYFDGSCCRHDDFLMRVIEDKPRDILLFKQRYVNEDDFCSWAEEGTFDDEGYDIADSRIWEKRHDIQKEHRARV